MNVFLVRHGQSEANVKQMIGRNPQAHLTDLGKRQATLLGEHLKDDLSAALKAKLIYCSPSIRTHETALCALKGAGISATVEDLTQRAEIDEIHRGDMEGVTGGENFDNLVDYDEWDFKTEGKDAESKRNVLERSLIFLKELEEKAKSGVILLLLLYFLYFLFFVVVVEFLKSFYIFITYKGASPRGIGQRVGYGHKYNFLY